MTINKNKNENRNETKKYNKKNIDKSINFFRCWEKKIVFIFHLGRCEKVELSWGLNEAWPEIDT